MNAATAPNTSVQLGLSPHSRLSANTLFRTLFTNLFMLSTEPWSLGRRGRPVTESMFGLSWRRKWSIDFAVNSFSIVSVENSRIANNAKNFLQPICNKLGTLAWQSTDMHKPCCMVLDSHNPSHQHSKWISLSKFA